MNLRARHVAGITLFAASLCIAVLAALQALGVWQRFGLPEIRPADVQGDWFEGDFSSHWKAWLEHGQVVRLSEQANGAAASSDSRLEYLFSAGQLSALLWPAQGKVTDPVALAAVTPHLHILLRQVALHRALPEPDLQCEGNEPFWKLRLRGDKVDYRPLPDHGKAPGKPRHFVGRWKYLPGSDHQPGIEWLGARVDTPLASLHMRIDPGLCLDATAGVKEFGPFTYRAGLIFGKTVRSGCCRPAAGQLQRTPAAPARKSR